MKAFGCTAAVVGLTMAGAFTIPMLAIAGIGGVSTEVQTGPSASAIAEIPRFLLARYEHAPACSGLPWQIIAAIGYTESRHGAGSVDPTTGDTNPHIIGIALDGTHSAAIRVPYGGSPWHDDPVWDHAVGPMQFITNTWARWGVDANGDGTASPHNAFDAIAAAGRYLCQGRSALDGIDAALLRYSGDPNYVTRAIDIAIRYGMSPGGDPGPAPNPPPPPIGYPPGPVVNTNIAPVINYALAQLGKPYVFGAAGPNSFDCSGLTMMAYQQIGIALPHYAATQAQYGTPIDWHTDAIAAGDLLVFAGGSPVHDYGHIGIALDAHYWINAPRTGDVVKIGAIPFTRIQAVRRLVIHVS